MSINIIQKSVCNYFNLNTSELHTKSRKRKYVFPRQIIMYLALKHLDYTLERAGEIYNLDHATALHAKKNIINLKKYDKKISSQLKQIELMIYNNQVKSGIEITHIDLLQLSINHTNSLINISV